MKLSDLALPLLGSAAILLSFEAMPVEVALYQRGCGLHLFNEEAYKPPNLQSLDQIPTMVRQKLDRHLNERLTEAVYGRLRFSVGQFIDSREIERIHSQQQKLYPGSAPRVIPSYELCFTYENPAAGIKSFAAEIQLREDGGVVEDIRLPSFRNSPEKRKLIGLDDAKKIALERIKSMFGREASINGVELNYRREDDAIVWVFSKTLEYKEHYFGHFYRVEVSAHDGRVLSSSKVSEIY